MNNNNNNRLLKFGANRLSELRRNHKKTMQEISIETGIARTTLSKIENNHREITIDHAKALSKYFNVSIEYLLGLFDDEEKVNINTNLNDMLEQVYKNSYDLIISSSTNKKLDDRTRYNFIILDRLLHDDLDLHVLKSITALIDGFKNTQV